MIKGPRKARGVNRAWFVKLKGWAGMVHGISEFAKQIDRGIYTIKTWERDKIIPPPTYVDEKGRRWYSDAHMTTIASAIREFDNSGSILRSKLKEIIQNRLKT